MKSSLLEGFSFGVTSGIITTLGLIVGLHSGTHSKLVVIGGILLIAVADAFSDSLGIHISIESERKHKQKYIWEATCSTFFAKFIFALTFLIPILLISSLTKAIIVSVIWGLLLLGVLSAYISKREKISVSKSIFEHLLIASAVIVITHYLGDLIRLTFV
jgi:VIT1/CCC1 family predicted Fe2+/Mn2+ transporter